MIWQQKRKLGIVKKHSEPHSELHFCNWNKTLKTRRQWVMSYLALLLMRRLIGTWVFFKTIKCKPETHNTTTVLDVISFIKIHKYRDNPQKWLNWLFRLKKVIEKKHTFASRPFLSLKYGLDRIHCLQTVHITIYCCPNGQLSLHILSNIDIQFHSQNRKNGSTVLWKAQPHLQWPYQSSGKNSVLKDSLKFHKQVKTQVYTYCTIQTMHRKSS